MNDRTDASQDVPPASRQPPRVDEGLFRLLVESVRDYAIFALDATGHILTWNAGARQLKGWEAHEIVGKHFSTFYPQRDIDAGKPDWELEVAERDGRIEDEGWRLRKDGSRFWANVVITALRNPQGELIGFAKVTRDLTDRRAAEEALRDSEERFRLLVQNVEDYAIFMLDPSGRVTSWNEGAERIKGYTADEIIGTHFSVFHPQDAIDAGKPDFELERAAEDGRFEDEGWRVRRDGTLFWANVVLTAVHNDDGRLIGFAKVTRDLTERRAAQERAVEDARRVAQAEAANRAKSDFLAAMSHELRTPLNAISGYVDILSLGIRGPVNEKQIEDLDRIRRSQRHLLGVINDLLNFSRVEAGRLTYDTRAVALDDVLDDVRPIVDQQAAARDVALEWPDDVAITVWADGAKLQQILINVLINAFKFTHAGGRVTLRCEADDDVARILVEDTGIGIAADRIESIFEPFVQIGRSLSSSHEGTGLGLAISRDLARAMGGDLTATSEPDVGSVFTLTLPLEAPPPA